MKFSDAVPSASYKLRERWVITLEESVVANLPDNSSSAIGDCGED
jgi:hypothetical protein